MNVCIDKKSIEKLTRVFLFDNGCIFISFRKDKDALRNETKPTFGVTDSSGCGVEKLLQLWVDWILRGVTSCDVVWLTLTTASFVVSSSASPGVVPTSHQPPLLVQST